MANIMDIISSFAIPAFIFIVLVYGHLKGVNVYESFVEGAKEGFTTAVKVLPYMVAMFVAIGIFRASGSMGILVSFISPVTELLGVPAQILPLVIMRPISGIASTGILAEIFKVYGPDSFIGRVASTVMGSTETIFYTLSIYFGAVGIKKIRYTLWAALLAEIVGLIASVVVCTIVFGR
ncbi:spore maturation protein B [Caldicoprobacter guelmensis]|uniref:spore maturation protein n=1 Tax=Caldicoprobacter guelmensis TaxID=1170224 RepID=UPI0019585D55|nr:spore maturation protein [Caldicoprobacter guelmensis]MBM7583389.1 spore maturation protein B [Caldicoprobacter guelmensis]